MRRYSEERYSNKQEGNNKKTPGQLQEVVADCGLEERSVTYGDNGGWKVIPLQAGHWNKLVQVEVCSGVWHTNF